MTPKISLPKHTADALEELRDQLPFISKSWAESAHLIDSGHVGELVNERPFKMRFPADARPAAERRRRRIAAARLKDRNNVRESGTGGTR